MVHYYVNLETYLRAYYHNPTSGRSGIPAEFYLRAQPIEGGVEIRISPALGYESDATPLLLVSGDSITQRG